MKDARFIGREGEIGRRKDGPAGIDGKRGRGSHFMPDRCARETAVTDRRKEIGAGPPSSTIRRPGLERDGFGRARNREGATRFAHRAELRRGGPDDIVARFCGVAECPPRAGRPRAAAWICQPWPGLPYRRPGTQACDHSATAGKRPAFPNGVAVIAGDVA